MTYFEDRERLWREYVPERGPADTVQGELLRAVEHLRDESVRNGNINWNERHRAFVDLLEKYLLPADDSTADVRVEIRNDLERARDYERPADEDVYDRLADHVVEWCRVHPLPMRQ